MLLTRTTEACPQTFVELLRESGIPPGSTVQVTPAGVYKMANWPGTSAKVSGSKVARKPASRTLTPAQSAALTDERRRLERENVELRRQLYAKEMRLRVGSDFLARIAASLKFPLTNSR